MRRHRLQPSDQTRLRLPRLTTARQFMSEPASSKLRIARLASFGRQVWVGSGASFDCGRHFGVPPTSDIAAPGRHFRKVGLHIRRRHQLHAVAQGLQLTRPMVRGCAGFYPHDAGGLPSEKPQHVRSPQPTTHNYLSCRIDPVDLKHRLRDIQPDSHNLRHDRLPSLDRLQRTLRYVGHREGRRPQHQ